MRVIAKSILRIFWDSNPKYRDAQKQITEWYNYCANAQWSSPHELKADLRTASILKKKNWGQNTVSRTGVRTQFPLILETTVL